MLTRTDASCSLIIAPSELPDPELDVQSSVGTEQTAVLAGGCFWCVEAVFKRLDGVHTVRSGYAGGTPETADYRTVCSGETDHAEVIEVSFDPQKVSFGQLLKIHFGVAHDPTHVDRQGNDVGRQYRSAIFYADEEQRRVAEAYIDQLETAGVFDAPIATTVEPLETVYEAEAYHQDYADLNPTQPYIASISTPKVQKLRTYFGDQLKPDES